MRKVRLGIKVLKTLFGQRPESLVRTVKVSVIQPRFFVRNNLLGFTTVLLALLVGISGWRLNWQIQQQTEFMQAQIMLEMHDFSQLQREVLRFSSLVAKLPDVASGSTVQPLEDFDLQLDLVQSRFKIIEERLHKRRDSGGVKSTDTEEIEAILSRWSELRLLADKVRQTPQNAQYRQLLQSQLSELELKVYRFYLINSRERKQQYIDLNAQQSLTLSLLLLLVVSFFAFALLFFLYAYRFNQGRQRLLEEFKKASITDELTQIYNRRYFDKTLEREWQRMMREQRHITLLLCDIDYFKRYNDRYGHQAGDSCLQLVAQCLRQAVHRAGDLVARYGGEEFAIVLPNTSTKDAERLAARLHIRIAELALIHPASDVSDYVTLSVGAAVGVPTSVLAPTQAIAIADAALYQSKANGRNRTCVRLFNSVV